MPKRIVIVLKDGKAQVRTEGFVGQECLKAVQNLARVSGVGMKAEEIIPTQEMFLTPQAQPAKALKPRVVRA